MKEIYPTRFSRPGDDSEGIAQMLVDELADPEAEGDSDHAQ